MLAYRFEEFVAVCVRSATRLGCAAMNLHRMVSRLQCGIPGLLRGIPYSAFVVVFVAPASFFLGYLKETLRDLQQGKISSSHNDVKQWSAT